VFDAFGAMHVPRTIRVVSDDVWGVDVVRRVQGSPTVVELSRYSAGKGLVLFRHTSPPSSRFFSGSTISHTVMMPPTDARRIPKQAFLRL
jgi:hypothetical protein